MQNIIEDVINLDSLQNILKEIDDEFTEEELDGIIAEVISHPTLIF